MSCRAFDIPEAAVPMIKALEGFPEQCETAVAIGQAFHPAPCRPRNLVMTGLGGSAIGAELLRTWLLPHCPVPVQVNRTYDMPAFVDQDSLVLVCSYSGNTEETVSAWHQARARGARVLLFSTGGELGAEAERHGIEWCHLPPGLQPRAALGLSFFPLLQTLSHLGLAPSPDGEVRTTLELLKSLRDLYASSQSDNPACTLAHSWADKVPVVYGAHGVTPAVAYRWKCQINENAKGLALWNELPELNHNESVGWSGRPELNSSMAVVLLATPDDPPRLRKRMLLTRDLVAQQAASVQVITAQGNSPLAHAFSLIHLGDWASLYLALERGQDPMEVRAIDAMKAALARGD